MRAGLRSDSTCGEVKSFLRAETLHSFPSPGAADRVAERRRPRQGCPPSLCRPVPRYEYKLQSRSRFWPMAGPLFCMAVLQLNFTRRPVTWSGVAEGSVRYRWRGTCAVRYIARAMELERRLLNPPPPLAPLFQPSTSPCRPGLADPGRAGGGDTGPESKAGRHARRLRADQH